MGVARQNKICREKIRMEDYPICYLCGEPIKKENELTQEHLLPKSKGGTSSPRNLAPAHKVCNQKRGITPLSMVACGCWKSGWYLKER
ncbi:MAG: HNH endonuclease [Methanobrevibacter sp.]|nr:HNH endonuclease [Methanobrevibacter sp.]